MEGESLIMGLKDVAVSSGSACTSASLEPSYVLRALGVEEDMAHTSIRWGGWRRAGCGVVVLGGFIEGAAQTQALRRLQTAAGAGTPGRTRQ